MSFVAQDLANQPETGLQQRKTRDLDSVMMLATWPLQHATKPVRDRLPYHAVNVNSSTQA